MFLTQVSALQRPWQEPMTRSGSEEQDVIAQLMTMKDPWRSGIENTRKGDMPVFAGA